MPVPLSDRAARWRATLAGPRPVTGSLALEPGRGYLQRAAGTVSVLVQIESRAGLDAISGIATVDGVDGVFLGPADLAASLGHLREQDHPEVVGEVEDAIKAITAAGKPAGVNAFPLDLADRYLRAGRDLSSWVRT